MAIVPERPHNKHSSSVFIKDGLKVNSIFVCEEENVKLTTVEIPGVLHSTFLKHSDSLQRNKPHIVI